MWLLNPPKTVVIAAKLIVWLECRRAEESDWHGYRQKLEATRSPAIYFACISKSLLSVMCLKSCAVCHIKVRANALQPSTPQRKVSKSVVDLMLAMWDAK